MNTWFPEQIPIGQPFTVPALREDFVAETGPIEEVAPHYMELQFQTLDPETPVLDMRGDENRMLLVLGRGFRARSFNIFGFRDLGGL